MLRKDSAQARISTRTILIGALLFNVIAIGLSEIQRRSLTDRMQALISEQEQVRKNQAIRVERDVSEQGKQLADVRSSLGALRVLIKDGRFASASDVKAAIVQRLTDGNRIIIRFDDNALESRDDTGAIMCGPETASGYLGAFVAGEEYAISYDKFSHQWTGSGPAQSLARDKTTGKCTNLKSSYGPKEILRTVTPADALILWGATLRLEGLDVFLVDQKVGRVVWAD